MQGIQPRGGRLLNSKIEKHRQVPRRGLLTIGGKFRWQGIELSLVPLGKYTARLQSLTQRLRATRLPAYTCSIIGQGLEVRGELAIFSILYCGSFYLIRNTQRTESQKQIVKVITKGYRPMRSAPTSTPREWSRRRPRPPDWGSPRPDPWRQGCRFHGCTRR